MQQENEALLLRGKRAARFRRGEGRVTSSATRTSLCEGWLQPPSSQTRSLHRLYTKIMRGPAINHIANTIVQLQLCYQRQCQNLFYPPASLCAIPSERRE